MPAFHDVQFPTAISYGSAGGPKFSTTVLILGSGYEKRNINWAKAKAEYNVAYGVKDRVDMEAVVDFFHARAGRGYSFRFKDWMDYKTGAQNIGVGDGATVDFQITKDYTSGAYTYTRDITKPVDGTLTGVYVNAVLQTEGAGATEYTIDYSTGIITFGASAIPAAAHVVAITECEFDVHARFDTDQISITHDFWETMSWPDIPIVEVREAQA